MLSSASVTFLLWKHKQSQERPCFTATVTGEPQPDLAALQDPTVTSTGPKHPGRLFEELEAHKPT